MTLVEVLVSIAIMSLIAGATVVAIHQLLTASARANDMQLAISQVRAAEHWMTRDILSAQIIQLGEEHGFPLTIQWMDADNTARKVEYSLVAKSGSYLCDLKRTYDILGNSTSSLVVASYINPESSTIDELEEANRTIEVTLEATVRGHNETRVFNAASRPEAAPQASPQG